MQSTNYGAFCLYACLEVSGTASNELSFTKALSFLKGFYFFINKLVLNLILLCNLDLIFWLDFFSDLERNHTLKNQENLFWLFLDIVNYLSFFKRSNKDRLGHISNDFIFHFISVIHKTLENIQCRKTLLNALVFGVYFFKLPVLSFFCEFDRARRFPIISSGKYAWLDRSLSVFHVHATQ